VAIEQNEIHEKETAEPARTERRKGVTSAINKDHFRKERLEKKRIKTSAKGREDKADNVTQKTFGMEDAPFMDGKTRRGKLKKGERMEDLVTELTFRERPELALVGFKEKMKALKMHEQQRDPTGDKRFFFAMLEASFATSLQRPSCNVVAVVGCLHCCSP
jgi:hypothetical protein